MNLKQIALYHEQCIGKKETEIEELSRPDHPTFDEVKKARDFHTCITNPEWRTAQIRRG